MGSPSSVVLEIVFMMTFCAVPSYTIFWGPFFPCRDCTQQTLTSSGGLTRTPVPNAANVRHMKLVRESSAAGTCSQGSTYGFIGSDAWVDQGCSGDFKICYIEGKEIV
ncbi:hypothetical protein RRG08_013260 [Elysia crispata]|uniref:Uncharacterized protein n=1 Tax=Elysia crispata TaxID=231223 RepID=A0AAE1DKL9_9GAST|nr:hypothetical protein RRG08_013260 [Elysia crispata]